MGFWFSNGFGSWDFERDTARVAADLSTEPQNCLSLGRFSKITPPNPFVIPIELSV